MRKCPVVTAIIWMGLLAVPATPALAQRTETLDKSFTLTGTGPASLIFKDEDGDLRFSAVEGNVIRIRVRKEADARNSEREDRLLKETRVEISQKGNEVRVEIKYPKIRGFFFWFRDHDRVRVSTEVQLPVGTDLFCSLVDGSVRGGGVAGKVEIDAVDGSIEIEGIKGDVRAETVDGRIQVRGLEGGADIRTTDGDIRLSGRIPSLRVETVDGDIEAELLLPAAMTEDWRVETVDGDIDLALPEDLSAEIRIETEDGHVDNKLPLTLSKQPSGGELRGTLNKGGRLLSIRSSEGRILLRKRLGG